MNELDLGYWGYVRDLAGNFGRGSVADNEWGRQLSGRLALSEGCIRLFTPNSWPANLSRVTIEASR